MAVYLGLSSAEALERLARDGPNELGQTGRRTVARIAFEVLREPMLAMLLAAGFIYLLLGDLAEALTLLAFAVLSVAITIVQEARTERVLESLRDLAAPRALVIRDGRTLRIPGREVVRDDMLVLEQGDRVAADGLLLEAREFEADESLLTGESVPVRKRAAAGQDEPPAQPGGDDLPHIFSGSLVSHGYGHARVTATGLRSRIGQIGGSLATIETEQPRLRVETQRIVRLCAIGGIGFAGLVVLLFGILRGSWLDGGLAGIAIGMSLLPEEFPVVLTIFLAMGAWRIAQVGVLTRRASAIETMGSATVLCTDKTGTLTLNRMTVSDLWLPDGRSEVAANADGDEAFTGLLQAGALASAPVPVDPMEIAFHEAARAHPAEPRDGWSLVHSYGLRPELLAVSNVWQSSEEGTPLTVAGKGAPEAIAELCRLKGEAREAFDAAAGSMARRGLRVLGIARAQTEIGGLRKAHEEHAFELAGLVGLADPLRPGVREAVAECHAAGIRVAMITGDFAPTARTIGAEAGLAEGALMTGDEVAALGDADLAERVGGTTIFARVMPEQKLRIVTALKSRGDIVAMTGDGVNDAPALKAAHIGIAMGKRGTDVAREASSLVLVEDDFTAIVAAVRLGRRIYDNIRKAMSFIFAVHVPIAGMALLPLVTDLPIVLGPLQIALLEMIIDPVCALVFEVEPEEGRIMQRPPRDPAKRLLSATTIGRSVLEGGAAFGVVGAIYLFFAQSGLPAPQLRALVFVSLVASILALILANRSFSPSIGEALTRRNRIFQIVLGLIAAIGALILLVPALRQLLQFCVLGPWHLGLALGAGMFLTMLLELVKKALPGRAG